MCRVLPQGVLSEDFKASDLEVGVVRGEPDGDRSFRVLTTEEVEHFLTVLSERD
jgi:20S proteasome subunit alpha 1